jgi:pyrimidine deaminase RibD-like protein
MRRAVDLAKRSVAEDRPNPPPKVGVVIVRDGRLLGESYRGATGPGAHAEYGLLEPLQEVDLAGAQVYTTLEPCSRRNHPKRPCAQRLIDRAVATVCIGMYDPNPRIHREGWRMLRDAGIQLKDFAPELRAEISADNAAFLDGFRVSAAGTGEAFFDYRLNHGHFRVDSGGHRLSTRWTQRGADSVWAYDDAHNVALARGASEFNEIDDPAALDFSNRVQGVVEGEIVVFRDDHRGFLLVKVLEVHAGPTWNADRTELRVAWEARTPAIGTSS